MDTTEIVKIVTGIYTTEPTDSEKESIKFTSDRILNYGDIGGVKLYNDLRASFNDQGLDTVSGWSTIREKARLELLHIKPSLLSELLSSGSRYIRSLPAGHSKGHFLRDAIHLTGILQDPLYQEKKIDEIEVNFIDSFSESVGSVV